MPQTSILVGTVVEWVALFPHSEKNTGVNSSRDFSMLSLHDLPVPTQVSSVGSGIVPQTKDLHARLTDDS